MMSKKIYTPIAFALFCLVSCREQEIAGQSDAEEQGILGAWQDWNFCRRNGGDGACRNSRTIVFDASSIARRRSTFASDPCDTDGQRDAFRHIYSMVWITAIYGSDFAQLLGDHRDPPPKETDDPQATCEQNMDRQNNNIGRLNSASIMQNCNVSAGGSLQAYTDYQDQVRKGKRTECVEAAVRNLISNSRDTSAISAVVINRAPNNSRQCWLVAGNTTVSPRGRTHCDQ